MPTIEGVPGTILVVSGVPVAGTNEVQTITIGGTPTGGTFVLGFDGHVTQPISWSSNNSTLIANIDAALEALGNIGTGNVTVAVGTMTNGIGTATVTFTGDLARLAVPTITVISNDMTGTSPTVDVAETTAGVTATARGSAKGTMLIDANAGKAYINTGSAFSPTWTVVGTQT